MRLLRVPFLSVMVAVATGLALTVAACGTHVLVGNDSRENPGPLAGAEDAGAGRRGAAPDASAGEISCGSNVCPPRDLGGGFGVAPPCCFSVTKCGASFSNVCVELDSAGEPDPGCPAAGAYPGCCRPNDTCGIAAVGTAFGCVDPFAFFPTTVLGTCVHRDPDGTAP